MEELCLIVIQQKCRPVRDILWGIEFDGFHQPVNLDIDEKDIALLFDSIGEYDFNRKQDMDEFIWKQRVLRCGEEISKLIEEGKKYR